MGIVIILEGYIFSVETYCLGTDGNGCAAVGRISRVGTGTLVFRNKVEFDNCLCCVLSRTDNVQIRNIEFHFFVIRSRRYIDCLCRIIVGAQQFENRYRVVNRFNRYNITAYAIACRSVYRDGCRVFGNSR